LVVRFGPGVCLGCDLGLRWYAACAVCAGTTHSSSSTTAYDQLDLTYLSD